MSPLNSQHDTQSQKSQYKQRPDLLGIGETQIEITNSPVDRRQPFFANFPHHLDGDDLLVGDTPTDACASFVNSMPSAVTFPRELQTIQQTPPINCPDALNCSDMVQSRSTGRRKINIEYIRDKSRRHITFSKRKSGLMKKAYELSALTGTQLVVLVASETGHVYTYSTSKLQPLITRADSRKLIQTCLYSHSAGSAGYGDSQTAACTVSKQSQEPAFGQEGMGEELRSTLEANIIMMRKAGQANMERGFDNNEMDVRRGAGESGTYGDFRGVAYSEFAQMRQYTSPPSGTGQEYFQGWTAAHFEDRQGVQFQQLYGTDKYGQMQGEEQEQFMPKRMARRMEGERGPGNE